MNAEYAAAKAEYRRLTKQIFKLGIQRSKLPMVAMGWKRTDRTYKEWGRRDIRSAHAYHAVITVALIGGYRWEAANKEDYEPTLYKAKKAADNALKMKGVLLA